MGVTSASDRGDLSLDDALELLRPARRRDLLVVLSDVATPASLPRIADEITELEHGKSAEDHLQERHRIYMSLYHTHVPKLEAAGVVSYTQSDDTVEWAENGPTLRTYLDQLPTSQ